MVLNKRNLESSAVSELGDGAVEKSLWRVGDFSMLPVRSGDRLTSVLGGLRVVFWLSCCFPYPNV